MTELTGAGASAGVVVGPAFYLEQIDVAIPDHDDPNGAFVEAGATVAADLRRMAGEAAEIGRTDAAEILTAQAMMAEDPMLADDVAERLKGGTPLGESLAEARDHIAGMLAAMDDEYLAARSHDVREVADRIGRKLAGSEGPSLADIVQPSIVLAKNLTAAETATMDPSTILGFVTEEGGPTGHVAVIARSLSLPAVVGATGLTKHAGSAHAVAFDGRSGRIVLDPSDEERAAFVEAQRQHAERVERAAQFRGRQVAYRGEQVRVAANVGSDADLDAAVAFAADGVGLYRTEFLFLDRAEPPSEDEQYELYRTAVEAFSHPVVVRTFDIGGDKPAAYLDLPEEENPFLGMRGVRIYDAFPDLFGAQLRALLRAGAHGDLWVMIPMVASVADVELVHRHLAKARSDLEAGGVEFADVKLGIMVEVPSAALSAPTLAEIVDFFSIGTNDLTQYTMAADRTAGSLAAYGDAAQPAVLTLCSLVAKAARDAGISAAVCGEAAADPVAAALFAAFGIDKLSVAPVSVDEIRATVAGIDPDAIEAVLPAVLAAGSPGEVRSLVEPLLP